MLSRCHIFLKARITAFSPWRRRPSGLARNCTPEMVHPGHFRKQHLRQNPDDPTRLLKPNHVIIKFCVNCQRTKYVMLPEKDHFHTCCEGIPMRTKGTMRRIMDSAQKLQNINRQWDVETQQPWSNAHKPRPKGRSKFAKK